MITTSPGAFRALPLVACLLAGQLFSACTPLGIFPPAEPQSFQDDLDYDGLEKAVLESLAYLDRLPPERNITLCGQTTTIAGLRETLVTLNGLLTGSLSTGKLTTRLKEQFRICRAGAANDCGRTRRQMVTGYYEPVLDGSLQAVPPFVHPLYQVPPDLVIRVDPETGTRKTGRLVNGELRPYWTRAEIDSGALPDGNELVYLTDPVEAFILHVQGSGRIRLRDGSLRGVHYVAANGRPYRSIGRLLIDEGRLPREGVDLPAIRRYLREHPGERDRILHHNESYVFFQWEESIDPIGSLGRPLTAGRSVAADPACFPPAAPGYLISRSPSAAGTTDCTEERRPLSRFVFIQDKGSAIKGAGRLDLYLGGGEEAGARAGCMQEPGQLYLLLKKE